MLHVLTCPAREGDLLTPNLCFWLCLWLLTVVLGVQLADAACRVGVQQRSNVNLLLGLLAWSKTIFHLHRRGCAQLRALLGSKTHMTRKKPWLHSYHGTAASVVSQEIPSDKHFSIIRVLLYFCQGFLIFSTPSLSCCASPPVPDIKWNLCTDTFVASEGKACELWIGCFVLQCPGRHSITASLSLGLSAFL